MWASQALTSKRCVQRAFLGVTAFVLAATASPAEAGPFGFEMGMTVKQVQALVKLEPGPVPGTYVAKTAPKSHPAFESYVLIFSPKTGLAKIGAIGGAIGVTDAGLELRSAFDHMEESLTAKYGKGIRRDELDPKSIWNGPGNWMTALRQGERVLESYWGGREGQLPDGVAGIVLMAKPLSLGEGQLWLAYEFNNFKQLKEELDQAL